MMNKLLLQVQECVKAELAEARKTNGDYFHSAHEGFGVFMEELDEAREAVTNVDRFADILLGLLRSNNDEILAAQMRRIEYNATMTACEYIQVAAMARKMQESLGVHK